MKRYIEKIEALLQGVSLEIKEHTYAAVEGLRAIYAIVDGKDKLIVDGCKAFRFTGDMAGGKSGVKLCPMNHENRLALNREFTYTAPQAVGRKLASFGFGDRLGNAGESHIAVIAKTNVKPILAQQSFRELTLTGRTYADVLDAATWAVFKSGYRGGYGADGDHLKSKEEVEIALNYGVSMITLDCSLVLEKVPDTISERQKLYEELPKEYREELEEEYLNNSKLKEFGIHFAQDILERNVIIYYRAIKLAEEVYWLMKKTNRQMDLEISLDETTHTTDMAAHYFVANELYKRHVKISSLAPKFVGEFQKAIDYIGDIDKFRKDLRSHCKIANLFGYKISIHSGSDKFKIFPIVAEETKGRFHLKTSGTSWLEAVRVIAKTEPSLYRDMHKIALENFEKAKTYYVVHGDPSKITPLENVPDEKLQEYMEQDDARQLLHITFGYMLNENHELCSRIFDALHKHSEEYRATLEAHFTKHLHLLGCF